MTLLKTTLAACAAVLAVATTAQADVACVQSELTMAGYNPGPVDGALGKKTVRAASKMAKAYNMDIKGLTKANAGDWCDTLKATNAAAMIDTEEKFREQIVNRKLTLKSNWVVIKDDGTMEGNFGKKPIAGTWTWEDRYWCRTMTTHSKNTDCQSYRVTPAGIVVARNKGKGKSFTYQYAE